MSLTDQINGDIKAAMLAREKDKLEALRAVKSALLLAGTEKGANGNVSDETGLKVLQKLVKQRRDAAVIYTEQNRDDLARPELFQAEVIGTYLPAQMGEDEVKAIIQQIIERTGASSPADMGKVMGPAMGQLQGKADGKLISGLVKELLSS
ncbi:MAG: GatB/YqeY domain-containing protein [Flavobacteriales bacterium]|nr:GatB/YqeY domain-containing protein [Flavobacteriales bacterium]